MTAARGDAGTPAEKTYDRIPLGVVRVTSQRKIAYANPVMKALLGVDPVGESLMSFVDSEKDRAHLEEEFRKRISGRASQYEIELTRPVDGCHVPVSISAAPEFDVVGTPIGSLAFIRDLSFERANNEVHRAIERESTMTGLFDTLCREMGKLIPFDVFRVTLVSGDREHLASIYAHPNQPAEQQVVKWWPMPAVAKEYLTRLDIHNLDVDEWFRRPDVEEQLRGDSATQQWRSRERIKHILVQPILRESEVIAFVALDRRNAEPFGTEQLRLCEQLPVPEVVLGALQIVRRCELEFVMELIRELGEVSDDLAVVARTLVERLQAHYQWEYVSLFQVDEKAGELRLLTQAGGKDTLIREGYTQPLDAGLLGLAYDGGSGREVVVGNVHEARYGGTYVSGIPSTLSEMCLPVPGSKVRWILNVEASQQNAFAQEDKDRVKIVLREAGFALERSALLGVKLAITSSIKDAVIQTNDAGVIVEFNPAAEELFGAGPKGLYRKNIADRVVVDNATEAVAGAADFPRTEVTLERIDGTRFPALLSCAKLPLELGGKVFVASDLSFQKRVEQTELLKNVFSLVAHETRVPLALVSTWLRRAAEGADSQLAETLDKSQRQLRKMDVTLERVLRVASEMRGELPASATIDLGEFLDRFVDELPKADAQRIDRSYEGDLPPVRATPEDLRFCVHNLFGLMMREAGQNERFAMSARRQADTAVVELRHVTQDSGLCAREESGYRDDTGSLRYEISSGLAVVKQTLRRMGGELATADQQHGRFAIRLPIAV